MAGHAALTDAVFATDQAARTVADHL